MKKQIDQMAQILQKNNIGDRMLKGAKMKNPKDQNLKKGNSSHALVVVNSNLYDWIVYSSASHHLEDTK
jgi:hypothetical protein